MHCCLCGKGIIDKISLVPDPTGDIRGHRRWVCLECQSKVEEFELGKCYKHSSGIEMKIVGIVDSTLYGNTFIGEKDNGKFSAVGIGKGGYSVNWYEISEEEWMKNFSK